MSEQHSPQRSVDAPPTGPRARRVMRFFHRVLGAYAVVLLAAIGVGHAASLGGINSDDVASYRIDGTVPPTPPTTAVPPVTTIPPVTTVPPTLPPMPVCGGTSSTTLPCVVPAGTTVDKVDWNADVLVLGTVTKDVSVEGGSVTIGTGGIVGRDIDQDGPGGVTVLVGATVSGGIKEDGAGSVVVNGTVDKKVEEDGDGDLIVGPTGVVGNDLKEMGAGSLIVQGRADKKVEEEGPGDLIVSGIVGSDASEEDDGSVTISGTVTGNVSEGDAGDLIVTATGRIGNGVQASPGGTCTVAPGAVVNGQRKGDCA